VPLRPAELPITAWDSSTPFSSRTTTSPRPEEFATRSNAHAKKRLPVEIEVRTREELREALQAGAEHLLLDNLTPAEARDWIREIAGRAKVELSGGITLDTIRAYAETGADFVSSGAITHSARAMDISFRLELV
jgi:nicotinate-nucleotide pyrophosphorylase (carboxylating)